MSARHLKTTSTLLVALHSTLLFNIKKFINDTVSPLEIFVLHFFPIVSLYGTENDARRNELDWLSSARVDRRESCILYLHYCWSFGAGLDCAVCSIQTVVQKACGSLTLSSNTYSYSSRLHCSHHHHSASFSAASKLWLKCMLMHQLIVTPTEFLP